MANPQLTEAQRATANEMLEQIRAQLEANSHGDPEVLWALRRKIAKELTYDERGHPSHRIKIKKLKRAEQDGRCPICGESLPLTYCVLDRYEAVKGYTVENTRLIHADCDRSVQTERGYR